LPHGVGRIKRQGRAAFAQHQQARDVIDLRIHRDDGRDAGIAHTARGLQFGIRRDLRQDIRRCVDEQPVLAVIGDGNGRLRARARRDRPAPHAVAIVAVAVPLRKAAARR
jgi:hypothetical protein